MRDGMFSKFADRIAEEAIGRAKATQIITEAAAGRSYMLGWAIRDMVKKGVYDAEAMGFCNAVALALLQQHEAKQLYVDAFAASR